MKNGDIMTNEEYDALTPDEQQVKVAETCGFIVKEFNDSVYPIWRVWTRNDGRIFFDDQMPDYLNDLNAMHEAEKHGHSVDPHWTEKWLCNMSIVISNGETDDYMNLGKYELATATAEQRAKAFVLTMETND